ncbi:anti-phage protein KwaB [Cohnella hongkongensis]|uniref:Anti-phage protein KwaB n=1 Tax=Cohnella hongkongensis TaxID=178337 RepID=A0ABV9F544_9BACL
MTPEELKTKISSVVSSPYSTQVYLVLKQDDNLQLKLADIERDSDTERESTETEITSLFSGYIKSLIVDKEDLVLCELSTADERNDAIYHYDYEEYPEELGLFLNFDIESAIKGDKFDFSQDDLSKLYGYIIYLGSMESGIVLFKKHYPVSLIKRDSFLLGAIKSKNRFEKIAGEDIIRLNGTAQLIRVEGEIFVTDLTVLERNFGFNKLIFKAAEDTIQAIEQLALIEDIQVLKDAAEESTFARKLSKVKKSSPIIKLNIPKEVIIEFTKNTNELAGKFKYSEDGNTIRLDTKKSKEAFLKLMNDAFLRSELTKQYYEVLAKDNITQVS